MKRNISKHDPTDGSGWTEDDFYPFDRYGNYIGEMNIPDSDFKKTQPSKVPVRNINLEVINTSLGIA
jgi:hypothetical protein